MAGTELIERLRFFGAQQHPSEIEFLIGLAEEVRPKKVLEIGTGTGTVSTLFALKGATAVVTLDIRDPDRTPPDIWVWDRPEFGVGDQIGRMVGDSHDPLVRGALTDAYDLVLIDGDHSYEGGKMDWEWYGPMAPVVGMHDIAGYSAPEYQGPEDWFPRVFWRDQLANPDGRLAECSDVESGGWGVVFK